MNTSGDNFELELSPNRERETTIKWMVKKDKYEIHMPILSKPELGPIVQHCMVFMHKVNQEVGDDPVLRYKSYVATFARTLSVALCSVWDNMVADNPIMADGDADDNGIREDVDGFESWISLFIEGNGTDDDRHELLEFIRQAVKPRKMKVQAFYIRL
jgi:hypothetical protein